MTTMRRAAPHAVLDGGERRCGELLIALKLEMDRLRSGEILKLVSHDPAAPEEIPRPLIERLAIGGRLIAPVGAQNRTQWITIVEKTESGVEERTT